MIIEKININKVKSPDYNPRKISDEELKKLQKSIDEFGYLEPIIINKRNMNVVGGNQRLQALRKLGYTEIDVVFVDLDDSKEKTLNLALNRISGDFDFELLEPILMELNDSDLDLDLTGFDEIELDSLLNIDNEIFDNVNKLKEDYVQDDIQERMVNTKTLDTEDKNKSKYDEDTLIDELLPEFNGENQLQYGIKVNFRSPEDMQKFAELVGQKITEKTKSIWYPEMERKVFNDKYYVEDEENVED